MIKIGEVIKAHLFHQVFMNNLNFYHFSLQHCDERNITKGKITGLSSNYQPVVSSLKQQTHSVISRGEQESNTNQTTDFFLKHTTSQGYFRLLKLKRSNKIDLKMIGKTGNGNVALKIN